MVAADRTRLLKTTAWLNVGAHAIGLVFAVLGMRPGTPLVPLEQRMAYLASFPAGWSLGWGVWMISALTLFAFLAVLARDVDDRLGPANPALVLAGAGLAIDLFCDALYISVLPAVASGGDPLLFLTVERAAGVGGTIAANGLYSVAVLLMAIALRKHVPFYVRWLGYGTFLSGMAIVMAGFTNSAWLLQLATGPTISLLIIWTLTTLRSLSRASDASLVRGETGGV